MAKLFQLGGLCGSILLTVGVLSYLTSGQSGPVTMAQVVLGSVLVGLYLITNFKSIIGTTRSRTTRYGAMVSVYTIAAIVIFISFNAISAFENRKIADLTEGQFLSLSEYSLDILKSIDDDLYITGFFVGEPIPKDMNTLELYKDSSSKVHFTLVNPDKRPDLTEEKEIRRAPTILIEYKDNSTKVSTVSEAAITNGIRRAIDPTKRVIYFTEGHGEPDVSIKTKDDMTGLGKALDLLKNEHMIVKGLNIKETGTIPKDANLVIIQGAKVTFEPEEITILGDYLDKGGRAIIMFNSILPSGLDPLAEKWGGSPKNALVLDKVPYFGGMKMDKYITVNKYSETHSLTREMDQRHPTRFLMPREILPKEYPDKGLDTECVIFSRPELSWAESDISKLMANGVAGMDLQQGDKVGPVCVATASTLNVSSVMDKDPEMRSVQSRVIVVGDSHFINNQLLDEARNFNPDLFLNMVEWTAGSEIIYAIRPKLAKIAYVDIQPENRRTIFYMSVVFVPELLLIIGLAIWWARR